VIDDDHDFYGREYWYSGQTRTPGLTTIDVRARTDLVDRCPHWLRTLLKYRRPPGRILEIGSSHGGFVALLRLAGFDATGLEISPSIVDLAKNTFDAPTLTGPVEDQALPSDSMDAVVLMDVLEHLPDPVGTLREVARLLRCDGILLIQTPAYPGGSYDALAAESSRFLEMLIPDQHLFLFNRGSLENLFRRLGLAHHTFEPAVFGHYDMFAVASPAALESATQTAISDALERTPTGRVVQALLDLDAARDRALRQYASLVPLQADVQYLKDQIATSENDRAARLGVIERQGDELARLESARTELQARLRDMETHLAASEQERAASLSVIKALRHSAAKARDLVQRARRGSVFRLARALWPYGVDAALARAIDLLEDEGSSPRRTTQGGDSAPR
jgi:SAM-dependent methyltransferase